MAEWYMAGPLTPPLRNGESAMFDSRAGPGGGFSTPLAGLEFLSFRIASFCFARGMNFLGMFLTISRTSACSSQRIMNYTPMAEIASGNFTKRRVRRRVLRRRRMGGFTRGACRGGRDDRGGNIIFLYHSEASDLLHIIHSL